MHNHKNKSDIFISYQRKGGLQTAGRIKDRLINLGYSVFIDLDNMEYGKEFPVQIKEAIRFCKDFLLILPSDTKGNALENKWIKFEICYAIKYNKRIIPILLEGYVFPSKATYPEVPKEFKEFTYVVDKFENLSKLNGIPFKDEFFDSCFEHLKKTLKSHRRLNRKKKIIILTLISLVILGLIIAGICAYNLQLPRFSLSLLSEESDNSDDNIQSWNLKYLITNKGGKLLGGKVIPKLRVGYDVVSIVEGESYKHGCFEIEFIDFYKDSYFFDDQNNTASIYETKADSLIQFICVLEEQLEKNGMYIQSYSIKTIFEVNYTDYFGIVHKELLESENNYNYMFTPWNEGQIETEEIILTRYYSDNALIKIREIEDALISYPLLNCADSNVAWIAEDGAEYINKNQNEILKTNVYGVLMAEDDTGAEIDIPGNYIDAAVEIISDDAGFAIGYHKWHENCNKIELE